MISRLDWLVPRLNSQTRPVFTIKVYCWLFHSRKEYKNVAVNLLTYGS